MYLLRMPYTQAAIAETMRLANAVPIFPVRMAVNNFNYMGYTIKKVYSDLSKPTCLKIHIVPLTYTMG